MILYVRLFFVKVKACAGRYIRTRRCGCFRITVYTSVVLLCSVPSASRVALNCKWVCHLPRILRHLPVFHRYWRLTFPRIGPRGWTTSWYLFLDVVQILPGRFPWEVLIPKSLEVAHRKGQAINGMKLARYSAGRLGSGFWTSSTWYSGWMVRSLSRWANSVWFVPIFLFM